MTNVITHPLEIIATGIYLPGDPIDSSRLERDHGIPEGWAKRYSGVEYRHWSSGETGTDMAVKALQNALDRAGLVYDDLDLIVNASATYDHPIPHNACLMQERMSTGKKAVPGFDLDATCLGFIVAMDVCARMLDGVRFKKIAIVCAELASPSLNPTDWETFTLLGDAATAVIIGYPEGPSERGVIHADLKTYPHAARYNIVQAGGNSLHGATYPEDKSQFYFKMEGIKLLRLAMETLPDFANDFFQKSGVKVTDIQCIVPHQASLAGLMMAQKILGITADQMVINLPRYGNTLAASVGLGLHEAIQAGRLNRGDLLLLLGTGAGFSMGGVLLRY